MGFIEIVSMDESGVTATPFENVDIVTYAEILAALAAGDVTDLTSDEAPNSL
jgi:hypothetical protein